jgi:hypothetical protein
MFAMSLSRILMMLFGAKEDVAKMSTRNVLRHGVMESRDEVLNTDTGKKPSNWHCFEYAYE